MVDTAASEFGLVVPFSRWTRIILRTLDGWRAAVGTHASTVLPDRRIMKCRHYRPEPALSPLFLAEGTAPLPPGATGHLTHRRTNWLIWARALLWLFERVEAGPSYPREAIFPQIVLGIFEGLRRRRRRPRPSGHAHIPFRHGHCRLSRLWRPTFTQSVADS